MRRTSGRRCGMTSPRCCSTRKPATRRAVVALPRRDRARSGADGPRADPALHGHRRPAAADDAAALVAAAAQRGGRTSARRTTPSCCANWWSTTRARRRATERLKVWPTNANRAAFTAVMSPEARRRARRRPREPHRRGVRVLRGLRCRLLAGDDEGPDEPPTPRDPTVGAPGLPDDGERPDPLPRALSGCASRCATCSRSSRSRWSRRQRPGDLRDAQRPRHAAAGTRPRQERRVPSGRPPAGATRTRSTSRCGGRSSTTTTGARNAARAA